MGAIAIYAGSVPGAIVGFCTGLLIDLALGQNLGATSLVLTALGYGVGRYRDLRDPAHGLLPIPVAAAATFGYLATVAAVSFMLEIGASVSALVLRDAIITAAPQRRRRAAVLRARAGGCCGPRLRSTRSPACAAARDPIESGPLGLRGLEVRR